MNLPSPPKNTPVSIHDTVGGRMNGETHDNGAGIPGGSSRAYPHLKDLEEQSVEGLNANQSINHLVRTAEISFKQAVMLLDCRKPDMAYLEYLRTFEILVNFIRRSPGYPDFDATKGPIYQDYWALIKRLNGYIERFDNVKMIIENDNKRNATQPRKLPASLLPGPQRSSMSSTPQITQTPLTKNHRPLSTPNADSLNGLYPSDPHRPKPPLSPKPDRLHGHALPPSNGIPNGSGAEALNERFARLRMMPAAIDTGSRLPRSDSRMSLSSSAQGSPVSLNSPLEYNNRSSFDILTPVKSNSSIHSGSLTTSRPVGPRAMQNGGSLKHTSNGLSLNAQLEAALPKAPDAAYNPARNMQTSGNFEPPRSTARSIAVTGGRSTSGASTASYTPGDDSEGVYPSRVSSNGSAAPPLRRKSVYLPREIRVGAEKLYDYLKMHNILLIDVRSREEFDHGHIYAHSVICVEPAALRGEMSADDLQDSLVLSPESEQDMFYNRDNYDLVVYYDSVTSSDHYLHHPRTEQDYALRYLHDALYEFNHDKPLQRPPILLMGGIEAWADLVGDQALKMSNTAARVKSGRPIRRVPVPGGGSKLQMPKKRLRDYNPLDADEERKWREKARVESVAVEGRPSPDEDDGEYAHGDDDDASQYTETIDDFNRRFPDANSIGQQTASTGSRPPRLPPKIPTYPAPQPVSAIPSIPRRPAPAAPRMSYSGVNERSLSQSQAKSADLPAYVPSHMQPANLRLPRTGLVNFGVTCYMNATVQALSATTPLSLFFLNDRYQSQVQRENWKGSKGLLPDLYANLVRSIWKGDVEAIKPSSFRQFCARLNREWGIDRQQDAKEFFDFLVDCLHEDLNANWSRTPLRALTTEQEAKRERMPKSVVSKKEWDRYTHREQSYVTQLFGGQHASRLRCTTCQFTSTTYEAFYSISVEIPRSGASSIEDCLKSYCAEEMLSGDEVWKCPQCNKEREATKQITITKAPQFLVVHFKRFSAGRGESARKVRTPIDFPLHNFNMEPYMLPPPSASEAQAIARDFGAQELKPDITMTPPYMYDAYAVMRHIGTTLTSGHYTCLARDRVRNCWRHFNDTNARDFDPDQLPERDRLQNEMAYIVFYQRMGEK